MFRVTSFAPAGAARCRSLVWYAAAFALLSVTPAGAHDTSGDTPNSRYTGMVSEQVARQSLTTYGVTGVTELKQTPTGYIAHGKIDDRDVDIEMDATTGVLREKNAPAVLSPARAKAGGMIRDHFMKINRSDMLTR